MQLRQVGPSALLLDCTIGADGEESAGSTGSTGSTAAQRWYAALSDARDRDELRCVDLVPAASTVLLAGLADHTLTQTAEWLLAGAISTATGPDTTGAMATGPMTSAGPPVTLTVRYDGPELARVAELWDVSASEAVRRHTSLSHQALFCGFAPGFSYLSGLPDAWRVPRLAEPRAAVPAGAVGLADHFTGVYPRESPGGWQLIGTLVDTSGGALFDPDRDPPALLPPGTSVRFVAER